MGWWIRTPLLNIYVSFRKLYWYEVCIRFWKDSLRRVGAGDLAVPSHLHEGRRSSTLFTDYHPTIINSSMFIINWRKPWIGKKSMEQHKLCEWVYGRSYSYVCIWLPSVFWPTWPASWEICMQVKKQQLELDLEQQTGSKSGKEYIKGVYFHPVYLTYMQSTSCEMLG